MQDLRQRRDLGKIVDAARIRKAGGGADLCQLKPKPGGAALHPGFHVVTVIDDDHGQIFRLGDRNRRQAAEAHQLLAVAGQHQHAALRLRLGKTEADHRSSTHRAPEIEVAVVIADGINVIGRRAEATDAIEVDDSLGRQAAGVLRTFGMPVPIVATPAGRWMFLTKTGRPLRRELAREESVTLHGDGSYVPLPPSPFEHGVVHWRVKPEVCGWRLPTSTSE